MSSYRYDGHLVRRALSSTDKMSVVLDIDGKSLSAARLIRQIGAAQAAETPVANLHNEEPS